MRSRDSIEREFATAVFTNGPMVREMDSLPLPDYSDYFEQFESSPYHRGWQVLFDSLDQFSADFAAEPDPGDGGAEHGVAFGEQGAP